MIRIVIIHLMKMNLMRKIRIIAQISKDRSKILYRIKIRTQIYKTKYLNKIDEYYV